MALNPSEISEILEREIGSIDQLGELQEVGYVIMVGDGVARVQGLENVFSSEMVELPNGVFGMAMNLEEGPAAGQVHCQKLKFDSELGTRPCRRRWASCRI